jgi:hypothetical protein
VAGFVARLRFGTVGLLMTPAPMPSSSNQEETNRSFRRALIFVNFAQRLERPPRWT